MAPDFSALGGGTLEQAIGALLTIVLIAAVATLVGCGICWAIGTATGSWQLASKGRTGTLASLAAAAAAGAAVAWINWLIHLGQAM